MSTYIKKRDGSFTKLSLTTDEYEPGSAYPPKIEKQLADICLKCTKKKCTAQSCSRYITMKKEIIKEYKENKK